MSHACHHPICTAPTPRRHLFCARHWGMLSPERQAAIWQGYQPGQERGKVSPSLLWLDAVRDGLADLWDLEGRPELAQGSRDTADRYRKQHARRSAA
jgi:hypothetical protein